MTFGSLFAGIGGFDLGLERAGMTCVWQVEIDPWCRRVLAKHWPNVERFEDVRECGRHNLKEVDLIAGGFPCQDISVAGKKAGIHGKRSGLWSEFARTIGDLRPRYVLVENVAALLIRGMDTVLGDLATRGYHAVWQRISAAAFGAPHQRMRVFIVANTNRDRLCGIFRNPPTKERCARWDDAWRMAKARSDPFFCGSLDGIPNWVDRLRGLGNSVLPQEAEWIGRQITAAECEGVKV